MAELIALTTNGDPDDYVSQTARGAAVDGTNWYNRVCSMCAPPRRPPDHQSVLDLRHVAATNAIAAGADVKLVQQMLGHKDASETLNTYAHLWPGRVAEVIAAVEKRRHDAFAAHRALAA